MKISFASDMHLEFGDYKISEFETDLIILAGDISTCLKSNKLHNLLYDLSNIAPVIYVPGNHDYYNNGFSLNNAKENLKSIQTQLDSLVKANSITMMIDPTKLTINDIDFIGCTLWTDLNNDNPLDRTQSFKCMNDYSQIGMTVNDWVNENKIHTDFIINNYDMNKKTVLITHHLPTMDAIGEYYKNDPLNYSFANTKLDNMICMANENLYCIHGHSHSQLDKEYSYNQKVRLLRNPRGYINYEHFAHNWMGFKTIEI